MYAQLTAEVVAQAASLAGRAPSLHNTQPWHWEFDGRVLQLRSAPTRTLPVTDPTGRQMLLSCGIAIHHMRTALAALGWHTTVRRFPSPLDPGHLADLEPEPSPRVTATESERAEAIRHRYTDRLPFTAPIGWDDFMPVLRTAFAPDDTVLDLLPAKCAPVLRRISLLATGLRSYDAAYHAELYWWTGHLLNSAGTPQTVLVSEEEHAPMAAGDHVVREPRTADRARVLAVSTETDRPVEVLRAGEIISAVLLECTAAGYATCTLTHITEFPTSRSELRILLGGRVLPQALIRVGTRPIDAQTPPQTTRLPLREILEVAVSAGR